MTAKQQDLFMQWFPIEVQLGAADPTVLIEEEFTTGLSIRGQYAWLIHVVEFHAGAFYKVTMDNALMFALSTVQGAAAFPDLTDHGVICVQGIVYVITTSGASFSPAGPMVWHSLPPTIIASPKLSFYAQTAVDDTALDGLKLNGRIGYTTVPIDQKMYLEIAETFETL